MPKLASFTRIIIKPIIIIGLFSFIFVSWSLSRSPTFQICSNSQTYYQKDNGGKKPRYSGNLFNYLDCVALTIDANHDLVIALGAFLTAIFTGTLWWSTNRLWRASEDQMVLLNRQADAIEKHVSLVERQIKVSEATAAVADAQTKFAVASMRARMVPRFPNAINPAITGWHVTIEVTNMGRAAGTIEDTYVRFCDELPKTPNYDKLTMDHREDQTTLSPGESKLVGRFKCDSEKDGQFLYGFFEFSDEIGRWRRRFCVQILVKKPVGTNIYYPTRGEALFNGEDRMN